MLFCFPKPPVHARAQFLEKSGDYEAAKMAYMKSGCGPVEITRMFFQAGRFSELENYIASQVCPATRTWVCMCMYVQVCVGM